MGSWEYRAATLFNYSANLEGIYLGRSIYTVDENYFETIDSEDKAYWLGFIYADGCIPQKRNSLIIELSIKDMGLLEKFNSCIFSNYKIKVKEKYVRLQISNKKFVSHLFNKGVIPRKSLVLTFPSCEIVPPKYVRDFIRGYFDGDGCIHIQKQYSKTKNVMNTGCEFNILGTIEFVSRAGEHLPVDGVKIYHATKSTNSYRARVRRRLSIIKIYHYLYDDANVFLERKRNIFKTIIEIDKNYRLKRNMPVFE